MNACKHARLGERESAETGTPSVHKEWGIRFQTPADGALALPCALASLRGTIAQQRGTD